MSNKNKLDQPRGLEGKATIVPLLLSPKEAASFIPCAVSSLNNSRYTGLLCGVNAPAYVKRGKSIFYKRETLESWNSQFTEQTSTSQN